MYRGGIKDKAPAENMFLKFWRDVDFALVALGEAPAKLGEVWEAGGSAETAARFIVNKRQQIMENRHD